MSIVQHKEVTSDNLKKVEAVLLRAATDKSGNIQAEIADYNPSEEVQKVRAMVLKHFILGTINMYTPRVEFNDMSLIGRDQYDQMSFNSYQPNNGEGWDGSPQSNWRSRALRPVVRNKCMSIAAHATARLIFPKVFAYNKNSDEQKEAAMIMEDLMEWSGDVSNYPYNALLRVITAMASPASIGYTEYGEVMRSVKTEKDDTGKWIEKRVRDESYPCFMDCVVPVNQLYIQNMFEQDIQKQGYLIWRKVYSYSEAQNKYGSEYDNFKYVKPGVQTIYDDANRTFYYVYDPNMRAEDVEEIIYWNKNLDLKIIMVNGIMLTEPDNPNPRQDKLYPFDKFGYEIINNRFFYYKSLAFKLQHDAQIVNTLYQMVIDGTYLAIFKPMVNVGGEIIASDVIVPGAVTTLSDPNSDLRSINVGSDLRSGLETLSVVEKSIDESSQEPLMQGQNAGGEQTAYEISKLEQNANTILGLFLQMISKHVKEFGQLRMNDILQYLTLPEVTDITGEPEMSYKTFFLKGNGKVGAKNKKVEFDLNIPDEMSEDEYMSKSYDIMQEEKQKGMTIAKVNPVKFREMKYLVAISPDVIHPRSTELERAFSLELYDRAIANPLANQEEIYKILLSTDPTTRKEPQKYIVKNQNVQNSPLNPIQKGGGSPLDSISKTAGLSTDKTSGALA